MPNSQIYAVEELFGDEFIGCHTGEVFAHLWAVVVFEAVEQGVEWGAFAVA